MKYFPAFINMAGARVVICGGGAEALEKLERIRDFNPEIHIVAREFIGEIEGCKGVLLHRHAFSEKDLIPSPVFVIAAEDMIENERIAHICREHHILVNAVDQPKDCDFIFPSIITTENLCVAVSTGGLSPTAAIKLRNDILDFIPDNIDTILLWAGKVKDVAKGHLSDKSSVNAVLRIAIKTAIDENRILSDKELEDIMRNFI